MKPPKRIKGEKLGHNSSDSGDLAILLIIGIIIYLIFFK